MTIAFNRRGLLAAGTGALIASALPAQAQAGVTGRNVTAVIRPGGEIVLQPLGVWEERGDDGGRFTFEETGRDDWSVYLQDRSRGVRLQVDLHRRQIRYADNGAPQYRDLYAITGSSAGVNGRNATRVTFAQGAYRMTGPGKWEERGRDGASFQFAEDRRDDWSIYLTDASRGVRLQLDLHTRKVMYADSGAPNLRPLYDITGSSAVGR